MAGEVVGVGGFGGVGGWRWEKEWMGLWEEVLGGVRGREEEWSVGEEVFVGDGGDGRGRLGAVAGGGGIGGDACGYEIWGEVLAGDGGCVACYEVGVDDGGDVKDGGAGDVG